MYTIFKNDTSIILTDDVNITEERTFLWNEYHQKTLEDFYQKAR